MNSNNAAVAHAPVPASSAKAAFREIPFSKQRGLRKRAGVSDTLHTTGRVRGNLQLASEIDQRDRIVLEHLLLVKAIAMRVHENLPVHIDLDDLVHAGVLGLFDAANEYNPDKQVVFSSYAKHRIKGAILDSLRQLDWASRYMRRHNQVEAATHDLSATLQRAPTEAEVADAETLGVDVQRFRTMMIDLRNGGPVSASARSN
jgi:RNA polymerase sigma factor for flagellar operon FliA